MPIRVPVTETGFEKSIQDAAKKAGRNLKINLGTSAKDINSLSQPLGRITGQADEFTKSMEAANARVLAFGASVGIINSVVQSFKALIATTIDVEKNLAKINSILKTSTSGLNDLKDEIFDIAKNTEQTFSTVADAALELSRQGLSATEVTKRLNDALVLSRLSGINASEAVAGLTAAVNSFSKAGLTTGEVLNKISNAANQFAVSERDLIEGFKRSASVAEQAGVSIDELGGIITAVQQKTARGGAVIGNSFKTIFTRIGRAENLELLNNLGVQITDIQGRILPATKLIENLAQQLQKLDDVQVRAVTEKIGGGFQIAPLLAALSDYSSESSIAIRATEAFRNATDEAYQKNIVLNQTLSAAINTTTLSVQQLAETLGKLGVTDTLREVLNFFNNFAQKAQEILVGEDLGSTFARGIVKGISNILVKGGIAIFAVLIIKLSAQLAKFGIDSLKTFLNIGNEAKKIQAVQQQIAATLLTDKGIREQILSIERSSLSEEKKRQLQAEFFTNSLKEQLKITSQIRSISGSVSGRVGGRAGAVSSSADGYLPIDKEKKDISKGIGGAPRTAKPVVIEGFNFGRGKKGTMVANDSEYIVPNYAAGGDAIFSQDMVRNYSLPKNAKAIGSKGYIPNFVQAVGQNFSKESLAPSLSLPNNQKQISSGQTSAKGYIPNFAFPRSSVNSDSKFILLTGTGQGDKDRVAYAGKKDGKTVAYVDINQAKNNLGQGKFKPVIIPTYGLSQSERSKSSAGTTTATDIDFLEIKLSDFSSRLALDYAKGLSPSNKIPDRTAKQIKSQFNKGALSGFAGSIFEVGLASILDSSEFEDYSSRTDTSRIDLPASPKLYEKFGVKEGGSGGAEVKNNDGIENIKSTAKKFFDILVKGELASEQKASAKRLIGPVDAAKLGFSQQSYKAAQREFKSGGKLLSEDQINRYLIGRDRKPLFNASKGYVPNYAMSPLQDAIEREKNAGVPVNQIRINQDGKLRNSQNPDGLAVTNTRDEPTGRIPNFAKGTDLSINKEDLRSIDIASTSANELAKSLNLVNDKIAELAREVQSGSKSFDSAQKEVEEFVLSVDKENKKISGKARGQLAKEAGGRIPQKEVKDSTGRLIALGTAAFALQGVFGSVGEEVQGFNKNVAEFASGISGALTTLSLIQGFNVDIGAGTGFLKSAKTGGAVSKGFSAVAQKLPTLLGKLAKPIAFVTQNFSKLLPFVGQIVLGFQGLSAILKLVGVDLGGALKDGISKIGQALGFVASPAEKAAEGLEKLSKKIFEANFGKGPINVATQALSRSRKPVDEKGQVIEDPIQALAANVSLTSKGLSSKAYTKNIIETTGVTRFGEIRSEVEAFFDEDRKRIEKEVYELYESTAEQAARSSVNALLQTLSESGQKKLLEDPSTKNIQQTLDKLRDRFDPDELAAFEKRGRREAVLEAELGKTGRQAFKGEERKTREDELRRLREEQEKFLKKSIEITKQETATELIEKERITINAKIAEIKAESAFQASLLIASLKSEREILLENQNALQSTSQLQKEINKNELDKIKFAKQYNTELSKTTRASLLSEDAVKKSLVAGAGGEVLEENFKKYENIINAVSLQVLQTGQVNEKFLTGALKINQSIFKNEKDIRNVILETVGAKRKQLELTNQLQILESANARLRSVELDQEKQKLKLIEARFSLTDKELTQRKTLKNLEFDLRAEKIRKGAIGTGQSGKFREQEQLKDLELDRAEFVKDQDIKLLTNQFRQEIFKQFQGVGFDIRGEDLKKLRGAETAGDFSNLVDKFENSFKEEQRERVEIARKEGQEAINKIRTESLLQDQFAASVNLFAEAIKALPITESDSGEVSERRRLLEEAFNAASTAQKQAKIDQGKLLKDLEEGLKKRAEERLKQIENFDSGIDTTVFIRDKKIIEDTFELASEKIKNNLLDAAANLTTFANLVRSEFNSLPEQKSKNLFDIATSADTSAIQTALRGQARAALLESGQESGLDGAESIRITNERLLLQQKELDIIKAKDVAARNQVEREYEKNVRILSLRERINEVAKEGGKLGAERILQLEKEIELIRQEEPSLAEKFGDLRVSQADNINALENQLVSGAKNFVDTISDGLVDAIVQGKDLGDTLRSAAFDFFNELAKSQFKAIFNTIAFGNADGGQKGAGGLIGGLLSAIGLGGAGDKSGVKPGEVATSPLYTYVVNQQEGLIGNAVSSATSQLSTGQSGGGSIVGTILKNTLGKLPFVGSFFSNFAKGGKVNGGSGSKDDVPAMLMGGEYVMRKSSVQKYGPDFMEKLNKGKISKFATGGLVKKEEKFQTGQGGYFVPGAGYGGTIKGKKALLDFATQAATSGAQDVIGGSRALGGGASYVALEPESVRLTNVGRTMGTPLQRATQAAKEQAFGLYTQQLDLEEQVRQQEKERKKALKRAIIGAVASSALSFGMGKLGQSFQAGGQNAVSEAVKAGGADAFKGFTGAIKKGFTYIKGGLGFGGGLDGGGAGVSYGGIGNMLNFSGRGGVTQSTLIDYFGDQAFSGKAIPGTAAYDYFGKLEPLKAAAYRRATGGYIPEQAGVDTVPTMLSGGEFVMNSAAAQRVGVSNLERINAGTSSEESVKSSDQELIRKLDELIAATKESTGEINITVNGENGGGEDEESKGDSSADQRKLARKLKEEVLKIIQEEKRIGGSLRGNKL